MSHEIVRDPIFLSVKSEPAEKSDIPLGMELIQALQENSGKCVGMAANMIGVRKRIIAINTGKGFFALMFNPVIIEKSGLYDSQEGCLSLDGVRNTSGTVISPLSIRIFAGRNSQRSSAGWKHRSSSMRWIISKESWSEPEKKKGTEVP